MALSFRGRPHFNAENLEGEQTYFNQLARLYLKLIYLHSPYLFFTSTGINAMQTGKEMAKELLDKLPDTATLDEIMYELYVKQQIEQGLEDSREGRVTPHEQAKLRYGNNAD